MKEIHSQYMSTIHLNAFCNKQDFIIWFYLFRMVFTEKQISCIPYKDKDALYYAN